MINSVLRGCAAACIVVSFIHAAEARSPLRIFDRWKQPVEPFKIFGDIYYVGTAGLAAYLIADGEQAILLDGTLAENAAAIEKNIAALGFKLSNVKIILNSHAHVDHAGAIAKLKRDSNAIFYASAGDRWALENGAHDGDTTYAPASFPAVKVDREVRDGDTVSLGAVKLTATLTPGHTKGCTTWSTTASEGGRTLRVIFPCSLNSPGNVLVGNKAYPNIVADYERSFAIVDKMKADIALPAHPEAGEVLERGARRKDGDENAFVDPGLLQRIVAQSRAGFKADLEKQKRSK